MKKGDREWLEQVRLSGVWWEPLRWSDEELAELGPWLAEAIHAAYAEAAKVFTPEVGKRLFADANCWHLSSHDPNFRRATRLAILLLDIHAPRLSPLVSLGLDLGQLSGRLPSAVREGLVWEGSHDGFAFELEILVALERARIPYVYEPDRTLGRSNPDFRLEIGSGLYIDAKFAQQSKAWSEIDSFVAVVTGRYDLSITNVRRCVTLTEAANAQLNDPMLRRNLLRRKDKLATQVSAALIQLRDAGKYPAHADIDGLVDVTVDGVNEGSGVVGEFSDAESDADAEAERHLSNLIRKGASQLPADKIGAVIVDITDETTTEAVADVVTRWYASEEGMLYPQLAGVLIVEGIHPDRQSSVMLSNLTPIWREGVPEVYRAPQMWESIERELNWKQLRILAWERDQRARRER